MGWWGLRYTGGSGSHLSLEATAGRERSMVDTYDSTELSALTHEAFEALLERCYADLGRAVYELAVEKPEVRVGLEAQFARIDAVQLALAPQEAPTQEEDVEVEIPVAIPVVELESEELEVTSELPVTPAVEVEEDELEVTSELAAPPDAEPPAEDVAPTPPAAESLAEDVAPMSSSAPAFADEPKPTPEPTSQCPVCGAPAPAGTRFCENCGSSLKRPQDSKPHDDAQEVAKPVAPICPNCGVQAESGFRFCMNCGTRLPLPAAPSQKVAADPSDKAGGPMESRSDSNKNDGAPGSTSVPTFATSDRRCPKCGSRVEPRDKFCLHCGSAL